MAAGGGQRRKSSKIVHPELLKFKLEKQAKWVVTHMGAGEGDRQGKDTLKGEREGKGLWQGGAVAETRTIRRMHTAVPALPAVVMGRVRATVPKPPPNSDLLLEDTSQASPADVPHTDTTVLPLHHVGREPGMLLLLLYPI